MLRPAPPVRLRLVESAAAGPREASPIKPGVDDSELLRAVRAGEDWAAAAFCRRVQPQVKRTVERLLGRQDSDLKDVVQVSLIHMVQAIDRFRGECSLDTWTATVTARAVFKHIRRRRLERRIFEPTEEAPQDDVRRTVDSDGEVVARDLLRRVRAHLADMDEDRAWAFLLHDVCGFDLRETAQVTGVSVAASQKRLVRGRHELRERLSGDPELAQMLVATKGQGP